MYGTVMDIPCEDRIFGDVDKNKILGIFFRPVFGGALVSAGDGPGTNLPAPPRISFRAAAMANMNYRPLGRGEYSFEWTIGKPAWLPRPKG
jgi:hypothetical protein